MSKITVTVREFSQLTGIGENSIREMCKMEQFPAAKIGNRQYIHLEGASEWLRSRASNKLCIASRH